MFLDEQWQKARSFRRQFDGWKNETHNFSESCSGMSFEYDGKQLYLIELSSRMNHYREVLVELAFEWPGAVTIGYFSLDNLPTKEEFDNLVEEKKQTGTNKSIDRYREWFKEQTYHYLLQRIKTDLKSLDDLQQLSDAPQILKQSMSMNTFNSDLATVSKIINDTFSKFTNIPKL